LRTILVEQLKKRCDMAKGFNINHIICSSSQNPQDEVMKLTDENGADLVINAAPATAAVKLSFMLVSKGGRVSLFASVPKDNPVVDIDANQIHYGQISVFGASDSTAKNHADALDLLASGQISTDALITHRLKLEEFFDGIDAIKNGEALKVVINP
jgi:L-iditol 2-dehydrogenase